MASSVVRRLSKHTVDWAKMAEMMQCNEMYTKNFQEFKTLSEGFVRQVASQPESLPPIDFAVYKQRLPASLTATVEQMEKQYKSLQVPYPKDTEQQLAQLDQQEKEMRQRGQDEIEQLRERVKKCRAVLAKWKQMPPLAHMTQVEWNEYFPELSRSDPLRPFDQHGLEEIDYDPEYLKQYEDYNIPKTPNH